MSECIDPARSVVRAGRERPAQLFNRERVINRDEGNVADAHHATGCSDDEPGQAHRQEGDEEEIPRGNAKRTSGRHKY